MNSCLADGFYEKQDNNSYYYCDTKRMCTLLELILHIITNIKGFIDSRPKGARERTCNCHAR